jgi:hypothetical protein
MSSCWGKHLCGECSLPIALITIRGAPIFRWAKTRQNPDGPRRPIEGLVREVREVGGLHHHYERLAARLRLSRAVPDPYRKRDIRTRCHALNRPPTKVMVLP